VAAQEPDQVAFLRPLVSRLTFLPALPHQSGQGAGPGQVSVFPLAEYSLEQQWLLKEQQEEAHHGSGQELLSE